MTDIFTKEKRSEIMKKVKSTGSKAEILLRKYLSSRGYRYRLHHKNVYGKPDICFVSKKIAVFVDGDFWHGRNYKKEKDKYQPFWQDKIAKNMVRDRKVNKELKKQGWTVIRIWEKSLLKDLNKTTKKLLLSLDIRQP